MPIDVADLVTDVKDRLNLASAATAPSVPTDAVIERWVRDGYRVAHAACQPVLATTVTVGGEADEQGMWAVALTADDVLYVACGTQPLLPVEWGSTGAAVLLSSAIVPWGSEARIWHTKAPDFTAAAIDSDCIFGTDWLAELAVLHACAQACRRQFSVSPSNGREGWAETWRTFDSDYEGRMKLTQGYRGAWISKMENALATRAAAGDGVARQTINNRLVNRSRVWNPLAGGRS